MLAIAPHVGVFQFAFLKAAQELGCFYTKGRVLRTRVFEITYQRKAQSVLDADPILASAWRNEKLCWVRRLALLYPVRIATQRSRYGCTPTAHPSRAPH